VGWFLDFYVAPRVKTYMFPFSAFIDMAHDVAAIPGTGDVPVVYTCKSCQPRETIPSLVSETDADPATNSPDTFDIAAFAAASLSLPKWEKETYAVGDRLTVNEFLAIAEEVKGTKFAVSHDSMETMSAGKSTQLPAYEPLYSVMPKEVLTGVVAVFGVMFENGQFDFEGKHLINTEFPEIKPRKVREMLVEAWGKK